jgi:hypothetical protein
VIFLYWLTASAAMINCFLYGSYHVFAIVLAYFMADWFTGLYHLLLDHFSWRGVPILERQAQLFQEHHHNPRDIVSESFSHILLPSTYSAVLVFTLSLFISGFWCVFLAFFSLIASMSQPIHRWSHMRSWERPALVNKLMKIKILLSPKHHMTHHASPYLVNYAIVCGYTNYITNHLYVRIIKWIKCRRGDIID